MKIDDLSSRIPVLNRTEDVNLNIFSMITGLNESKTLIKHILSNCRCKLMIEDVF